MKKFVALMLAGITVFPMLTGCDRTGTADTTAASSTAEPDLATKIETLSSSLTSSEAITQMRQLIWEEYVAQIKESFPERESEIQKNKTSYITIGKTTMKVMTKVVGRAPEDGYPLFLIYHGGGTDPTGEMNEGQWAGMADRYTTTNQAGIYCSIRSVSDDAFGGQIFSTPISWPFYDRIIEDSIIYMNADPNKVYIVGYSAGGNGVYQIAPRITDRLASATMTAGHPEGIDLTNLYNLPFFLQVGELDDAYSRNTVTVEYSQKLDALAEKYGGGYEHYCFVHKNTPHGSVGDNAAAAQAVVMDNDAWLEAQKNGTAYKGSYTAQTTHAADLMTEYRRDPLPTRVVWNAATTKSSNSMRTINSFYWLSSNASKGMIDASYDKASNTVTIHSCTLQRTTLTIYLNEEMVDLFSPVTVIMADGSSETFTPEISLDLIRSTTAERGDPNYQFCASYTIRLP